MFTILLDSSNRELAVGLSKDGCVLKSIIYEAWQAQSEYMIPELDKLLKEFEVKKEDIKDVVVSNGPGSYTGVRIAVTIAKVMACVLDIPLYHVSSLQILKCDKKPSICLINARSNRSYIGVYENDKCLLNDQIMENDDVLKFINDHPNYVVCGDTSYLGIEGYKSNVIVEMNSLLCFLKPIENSYALRPLYLKD